MTDHGDPITSFDWERVKTSKRYRIVTLAVDEASCQPVVVYRSVDTGAVWVRPAITFFDGRFRDTRSTVNL